MTSNNNHAPQPTPHQPLAILSMGMVTALGGTEATCAAMRVKFNNHKETSFFDRSGRPIVGSLAAIDPELQGDRRWEELLVQAVYNCKVNIPPESFPNVPVAICLPAQDRLGRPTDDKLLLQRVQQRLGVGFYSKESDVVSFGNVSGLLAIKAAQAMIYKGGYSHMLLLAAESLFDADLLTDLDGKDKLLTLGNPHGLIPGEAAVAMWLGHPKNTPGIAVIESTAFSAIQAAKDPKRSPPVTGRELAQAIHMACIDANCTPSDIDVTMTDCNGLDIRFKETALAQNIAFKDNPNALPPLWIPAESLGDIGAANSLCAMAWADHANRKNYLPGKRVLVHSSSDGPLRGAAVLRYL